MFYVSRVADVSMEYPYEFTYGVVDTDDGVEELYTGAQLSRILQLNPSIEIAGITTKYIAGIRHVLTINVYQFPEYVRPRQQKLKSLFGIEIVTFKDVIVSITGDAVCEVAIRLSDYGKSCNGILQCARLSTQDRVVRFILDDNIQIQKETFLTWFVPDACYDIREVSCERTADYIYDLNRFGWRATMKYFNDNVIDNPDRHDLRVGKFVIKTQLPRSVDHVELRKYFYDFDTMLTAITNLYGDVFRRFVKDGVVDKSDYISDEDHKVLYAMHQLFASFSMLMACSSGINIVLEHPYPFEQVLRLGTEVDMRTYKMFLRYIKGLYGTDEFRSMFNKFVSDVVDWYTDRF